MIIPSDEVRLIYSGNHFFDTLKDIIKTATHTIHFQMYIFENDETGKEVAEALKNAAGRGVQVNMIVDAFGSKSLPKKFIEELKKTGIQFRWFAPFFSIDAIYLGRRLHHKVIVVDQHIALIGGINISNKYKGSEQSIAWLDYAVLIKGNTCETIHDICSCIFDKKIKFYTNKKIKKLETNPHLQIRQNDRLRRKNEISKSYANAIRNAKHSITLVASYFLPGSQIKKALLKASKRGVHINIILTGVADIPLMDNATRYLYRTFLKEGIDIYEWKKSVLHGKLALIDNEWATVGSFNLNHLSALRSIEFNIDVKDDSFIDELQIHLKQIMENGCDKINYSNYLKTTKWYTVLLNLGAYYIARILMRSISVFPKVFFLSKSDAEL